MALSARDLFLLERDMARTGQVTLDRIRPSKDQEITSALPVLQTTRLVSLDAYRGFVMLVLVSGIYTYTREGFGFPEVARHFAGSAVWQFLAYQFSHVAWQGASFWDLIMPSFVFMVGVAMPYSYSNRLAKGHSHRHLLFHALYRSIALTFIGTIGFIFLGNLVLFRWPDHINIYLDTVLPQIGLGYLFVFLML